VSIPFTTLECDKCGFQGGDGLVNGDFRYVDGHFEMPVRRTLGWCSDCQSFAPIEDFNDKEEVTTEIQKIIEESKIPTRKRLSFSLFSKPRNKRVNRFSEIPALNKRLALIEKRQGHEKCLHCGSVNVSRFDGDYSEIDTFTYSQKIIHTGYFHPGCGGEILATASPMRFFIKYEPKFYSVDGYRIEGEAHQPSDW
jgi:hypothetical protein